MFWNILAAIGILAGFMAVVFAIGCLYVMNEIRNEINQEKYRAKNMIWAGMNKPSASDDKWATDNGYMLWWSELVPAVLQNPDYKERSRMLLALADMKKAGIVTDEHRVINNLEMVCKPTSEVKNG